MKILDRKLDIAKTKKDFKKVLGIYDLWGRFTESKAARKVLQLADIKDQSSILEVACGTGVLLEQIARQNPHGQNIGMDLSPDMLQKDRTRLSKLHNVNFELREGNALHLDFPDNTFDLLVNNYMVDLMPVETFETVAAEFFRVLKPGGKIVIATFSFGTRKIHRFWYWLAKHFPDLLTGCRPVSFGENLVKAGFIVEKKLEISQNTFPSEIIRARK